MSTETDTLLLKKAGALLARRAFTCAEMRERLAKIAGDTAVEPVLERLQKLNLLNDAEYAYNFALCRIRQDGWSRLKVRNALLRRQVQKTAVDDALERIRDEVDDDSALASYVRKYCGKRGLPKDPKALRKLITHLLQRGFEEDSVFGVLRQMVPAELLQRFETGD